MVDTRRLHLFGERHKVWLLAFLQTPVLVRPELARSANTRLHFVDDKVRAVFLRNKTELAEVGWRGVFVSPFRKDRLNDDSCDGS